MTREDKRETLQIFASFPPMIRKALAAGKVLAELEAAAQQDGEDKQSA